MAGRKRHFRSLTRPLVVHVPPEVAEALDELAEEAGSRAAALYQSWEPRGSAARKKLTAALESARKDDR